MQFIVFGKLSDEYHGKPISGLQEVLKGEWEKSREWYAKGYLRQSWLFENNGGSIGIFEVESREKMDEMIADYPGMGFHSFNTACRTIRGIEAMNMIRKGQIQGIEKGDVIGQLSCLHKIFGVAS